MAEIEAQRSPELYEEPSSSSDFEKMKHGDNSDNDSDSSSTFSERHMEGPNSLTQTQSRTLQRAETAASNVISTVRSRIPVPAFSHPLENAKTGIDVIVDFDGKDDPYRPMNWLFRKKAMTTMLFGVTTMTSSFGSSVYSPGVAQIAHEFKVGNVVATLGVSLMLAGFGLGPLLWAPLSEIYGRKLAVLTPVFISAIFTFGAGAGENIQTIMICRFFQGFFGSAPVTNTGGVLGDIWSAEQRGGAMSIYAVAVIGGPTLGPIVGGAICHSSLGWRWTQYITGIFQLVMVALDVLLVDESYPASLLVKKASRLRHESGNWALHAKHEEWDISLSELGHKYLVRPFQLLTTPICFLMALYASFCYGILYASLSAFPVEFEEVRGWNQVVGSLPFLAMLLGVCIGAGGNYLNTKYYTKAWLANNRRPVPEARLPPMMFGSVLFTAGLFMFAWSSDENIFWLVPCIGIVLIGIGFATIFQSALNFLVDTFQRYAASAVAANTFLRSVFAAAFPLFITPELHNIGIGWGVSVFAFVAALLIPIPFLFFIYGKRIRARGTWSRESVYPD